MCVYGLFGGGGGSAGGTGWMWRFWKGNTLRFSDLSEPHKSFLTQTCARNWEYNHLQESKCACISFLIDTSIKPVAFAYIYQPISMLTHRFAYWFRYPKIAPVMHRQTCCHYTTTDTSLQTYCTCRLYSQSINSFHSTPKYLAACIHFHFILIFCVYLPPWSQFVDDCVSALIALCPCSLTCSSCLWMSWSRCSSTPSGTTWQWRT